MALEPLPIKKLEQEVINRIAAGEVIQRPANALKELIENSLDAKSTNIQITVKNGGLKLLQIQDNGTGIRKDDFEIVCERFTTSKLREFEDLQKIATYGFRGEALASISHVAHLSVVSKTKADLCAYQAEYCDSKLKAPPKPLAGNQGTIIIVEDLFYNMNVRKKALRSPAEEYQKISDIVSKYSIHNASVGFALKKHGGNNDIRTPINSTHVENIRLIYGSAIARELVEFNLEDDNLGLKVKGYITNVNYSTKKFQFLLFINHRLVECQSLKKCLDTVYQTYLPKNTHPFVYLSLELDPNNIDVNVHPTKHEVHFLNEDQIVECITTALEQKLLGSNSSRIFYTQAKLPTLHFETKETLKDGNSSKKSTETPKYVVRTDSNIQKLDKFFNIGKKKDTDQTNHENIKKKMAFNESLTEEEYKKHHEQFVKDQEDFENRCLEKTFNDETNLVKAEETKNKSKNTEDMICNNISQSLLKEHDNKEENVEKERSTCDKEMNVQSAEKGSCNNKIDSKPHTYIKLSEYVHTTQKAKKCEKPLSKHLIKKITRVETKLTSILQLRKCVENDCHRTLRETFAQHVFVGSINPKQALIQYGTQLLLCNTKVILEELFYQLIIYNFQNFDYYRFAEPMSVKELALFGLDLSVTGWTEDDGPKEELAERIGEILIEKRAMLNEYFSVDIDEKGKLKGLPIILDNYVPDPFSLPLFIIRLATEVNWETEKECFDDFSRETAMFYSNVSEEIDENGKSWKWVTEYVLYPAIKEFFIPPKSFTENAAVLEIASLPNLYKVFERC